ncbi:hypothetical protein Trco_001830 [Trichoderma cornu-damae]|uniref:Cupin type-2 domain-containing protein n=1 Tax=Trichoderma cornu-damae TaxID=654480 RepID=A0A9P8TYK2_9HYPO|nr:hypothetical protein Trco_001830 [Trichoderma cornu-damae]
MTSFFPDPRRIVTGHSSEGKAIVVADSPIPCLPTPTGANFAVLYETHQFPASNDEWIDPTTHRTTDLANGKGIVLRVVDIPPNVETMFHRTESLDFGILHSGQVTCHLDDGVRVDMKPGDVCVQRGTIHGWTNHSDKPARLYFILSAAAPVNVQGTSLTATGYSKDDVQSGGLLSE